MIAGRNYNIMIFGPVQGLVRAIHHYPDTLLLLLESLLHFTYIDMKNTISMSDKNITISNN